MGGGGLSDHDIWQLNKLYGCKAATCPAGTDSRTRWHGGQCPSNSVQVESSWFSVKCQSCCQQVDVQRPTAPKWFGTAPFCNGACPSGWTYVQRSAAGDGA